MHEDGERGIWMLGGGIPPGLPAPPGQRPNFKLVGMGGAGLNILSAVQGFPKAAISVSEPHLRSIMARERMLFSSREVEALSSVDPSLAGEVGVTGAKELRGLFDGVEVAFIVGGVGGTLFGPLSPFVCRAARQSGALVVCIGILPFTAEGPSRMKRAASQMGRLQGIPHGVVHLGNDTLASIAPNLPLAKSFSVMDHVVAGLLEDMSSCIVSGDIPRLKSFLDRAGPIRLTGGSATHRRFPEGVVSEAMDGPWLAGEGKPASLLMILRGEAPEPADALSLAKALGEKAGPFDLAYALRSVPSKGKLSATLLMGSGRR